MTRTRAAQILSEMIAASRELQDTQPVEVGVADLMREQIEAMELAVETLRHFNRQSH